MVASIIRDLKAGAVSVLHVAFMVSFMMDRISEMDHAFIAGG